MISIAAAKRLILLLADTQDKAATSDLSVFQKRASLVVR